ncbi:hypothetical protein CHS0354_027705, partial [Potamilus streckersoni]
VLPGSICMLMHCSNPVNHQCLNMTFRAAPGTPCGTNMVHTTDFQSQSSMTLDDALGSLVA